jgi:ATP-dependent Lon protease
VAEERDRVGVVTGLVRTQFGGDIVFVEATSMKGKGELLLTGSLRGVMRRSAQAALSFLRSQARQFAIPEDAIQGKDVHIHVPAGAIPKDGPSARLAIAMALLSLFTGREARRDVVATVELTLTGRTLPVSVLGEKLPGAQRARIKAVVLPERTRSTWTHSRSGSGRVWRSISSSRGNRLWKES